MFVVSRTQPAAPDTSRTTLRQTRSAARQSQRSTANARFSLPQDTLVRSTRADDTSPARPGSQNTASAATSPANISTATSISTPAVTTGNLEASGTGMQKLLDTMKSLGMSTAGLNISYSEDFVGYPGGGYMNKLINVTAGGKTEHFSADLTDKNPTVTANELQLYFGVTPNTTSAAGYTRQG